MSSSKFSAPICNRGHTPSTDDSQGGKCNKNNLDAKHVAFDEKIRVHLSKIGAEGMFEELREFYNENAKEYEEHRGHVQAALGWQALAKAISAAVPDKNARLLDCAAGGGGAGQCVLQQGFTNIDALEPSSSMLQFARQKNIYCQLYCAALDPDKKVGIADGTYDVVFMSAAFLPGHVDVQHLPEIIRILKPGGLIIFNVSDKYLTEVEDYTDGKLDSTLQSLQKDDLFESVSVQRGAYRAGGEECNIYTIQCNNS